MSNDSIVRVFVENRSDELIVQGMFAEYVRDERLLVSMCWTASSAISLAESWLLTTPAAPVALALNCSGDPREFRTPIENILYRAAPKERWNVALAVPGMSAWLLKEPMFAASLSEPGGPGQLASKADLAVYFQRWVQQRGNHFDRDEVGKQEREFAALNGFVEKQVLSAASAAE